MALVAHRFGYKFDQYKIIAQDMGFKMVHSGPLVRSSYHAAELAHDLVQNLEQKLSIDI